MRVSKTALALVLTSTAWFSLPNKCGEVQAFHVAPSPSLVSRRHATWKDLPKKEHRMQALFAKKTGEPETKVREMANFLVSQLLAKTLAEAAKGDQSKISEEQALQLLETLQKKTSEAEVKASTALDVADQAVEERIFKEEPSEDRSNGQPAQTTSSNDMAAKESEDQTLLESQLKGINKELKMEESKAENDKEDQPWSEEASKKAEAVKRTLLESKLDNGAVEKVTAPKTISSDEIFQRSLLESQLKNKAKENSPSDEPAPKDFDSMQKALIENQMENEISNDDTTETNPAVASAVSVAAVPRFPDIISKEFGKPLVVEASGLPPLREESIPKKSATESLNDCKSEDATENNDNTSSSSISSPTTDLHLEEEEVSDDTPDESDVADSLDGIDKLPLVDEELEDVESMAATENENPTATHPAKPNKEPSVSSIEKQVLQSVFYMTESDQLQDFSTNVETNLDADSESLEQTLESEPVVAVPTSETAGLENGDLNDSKPPRNNASSASKNEAINESTLEQLDGDEKKGMSEEVVEAELQMTVDGPGTADLEDGDLNDTKAPPANVPSASENEVTNESTSESKPDQLDGYDIQGMPAADVPSASEKEVINESKVDQLDGDENKGMPEEVVKAKVQVTVDDSDASDNEGINKGTSESWPKQLDGDKYKDMSLEDKAFAILMDLGMLDSRVTVNEAVNDESFDYRNAGADRFLGLDDADPHFFETITDDSGSEEVEEEVPTETSVYSSLVREDNDGTVVAEKSDGSASVLQGLSDCVWKPIRSFLERPRTKPLFGVRFASKVPPTPDIQDARRQPKSPEEETQLAAKYAAITDIGDRAYAILKDLEMIE